MSEARQCGEVEETTSCVPVGTNFVTLLMADWDIRQTDEFGAWLNRLKDAVARAIILRRIDRVASGNFGDVKAVGDGVSELRIDHGPGYRVYFARRGKTVIVLLCAGDKSSQAKDILRAKALSREI
jgi:putative addiction module killer protein